MMKADPDFLSSDPPVSAGKRTLLSRLLSVDFEVSSKSSSQTEVHGGINETQGSVLVCSSVDGDSQGVERIFGALSAHMWPGMILKSGDMITELMLPHGEEFSEEESEYELEYEVLSADPWENSEERWVSASETHSHGGSTTPKEVVDDELRPSPDNETERAVVTGEKPTENDKCYEFEDVEQLMSEIGNNRDNLQLMPDFQRREIAANLAMKMASMFGGDTDGEEES